MTSEILTLNQQDLETLLSKGHCACHFINPNKTRIILWKERSSDSEFSQKEIKDDTEIYYLRIGIQKFISYPLKDKNKAIYWRFNCFEKLNSEFSQTKSEESINPDSNSPITKYQQRLAKTEALNSHGNDSNSN